jgi:hypothetical protein
MIRISNLSVHIVVQRHKWTVGRYNRLKLNQFIFTSIHASHSINIYTSLAGENNMSQW